MSIDCDDREERQIRVDRMIDQFRKAQARRVAKATAVKDRDPAQEPHTDDPAQVVATGSPPSAPAQSRRSAHADVLGAGTLRPLADRE